MIKFCLWIIFHENTSKVYKATSCISIMINQCYRWCQIGQRSSCWTIDTNGLACHLKTVCKLFPRLLNYTDCQTSQMSYWFAQGLLSRRHMCLCMSSWGTCLKSHSPVPQAEMMLHGLCTCSSPLTPPSDCLLLFTTLLLFLSFVVSCCKLFLISPIPFPFLHWLFKKKKHLLGKNYVPSTVRHQMNKTDIISHCTAFKMQKGERL